MSAGVKKSDIWNMKSWLVPLIIRHTAVITDCDFEWNWKSLMTYLGSAYFDFDS